MARAGRSVYELHAELCQTLSNPKRLEILSLLRGDEKTVGELVRLSGTSQANLSQHLAILRRRKLLTARREGVNIYYRISNPKILKAYDIIQEILFEQLAEARELAAAYTRRRGRGV